MSPTPRPRKADAEEDDALYTPKGCKEAYEKLENCLAVNDRDWTKCQAGTVGRVQKRLGKDGKAFVFQSYNSNTMQKMEVLRLYRHVLRAAARFPSVKRAQVLEDIKKTFRDHKDLSDPARIQKEVAIAQRSLGQMEAYTRLSASHSEWAVSLKGPLD